MKSVDLLQVCRGSKIISGENRFFILFFVVVSLILILATMPIMAYGDDISYATAPRAFSSYSHLLPIYGGWRPFDNLLGYFLYYVPFLYPFFNHVLALAGHIGSAFLLVKISNKFGVSARASWIAAIMFLMHANVFATFSSVDSVNQSLCLFVGLLSVTAYLNSKFIAYLFLICFTVALKESGGFFFLLAPVLKIAYDSEGESLFSKKFIINAGKHLILGTFFICLYFTFTFGYSYLHPKGLPSLGSKEGWYGPIAGTLANLGRISTIDMPAILLPDGNMLLFAAVTFFLSVPVLLALAIYACLYIFRSWYVLALCGVTVFYSAYHAFAGAVTEMNSYPTIFFAMLFFAFVVDKIMAHFALKRIIFLLIFPFLLGCVAVLTHKFYIIYETNRLARELEDKIDAATFGNNPDRVYIFHVDCGHIGHDIYQPYSPIASGSGLSIKKRWNKWDLYDEKQAFIVNMPEIELYPPNSFCSTPFTHIKEEDIENTLEKASNEKLKDFDAVWILFQDGRVIVKTKADIREKSHTN